MRIKWSAGARRACGWQSDILPQTPFTLFKPLLSPRCCTTKRGKYAFTIRFQDGSLVPLVVVSLHVVSHDDEVASGRALVYEIQPVIPFFVS